MHSLFVQSIDHHLVDSVIERNTPLLLSKPSYWSITEYFIGIKPSWLCYCCHKSVVLGGYNLNRVARQYGFTQATPLYGLLQISSIANAWSLEISSLYARLGALSVTWDFLLHLGTNFFFYIALWYASTRVSHIWLLYCESIIYFLPS